MELNEGLTSGRVTLKEGEAQESFGIASRTENSNSNYNLNLNPNLDSSPNVPQIGGSPPVGGVDVVTKKRGRPRKYGPDGSLATALSPMPISASIPLTGDFSVWKRGRGRAVGYVKKQHKYECGSPSDKIACSVGANFTPHVLTVHAGEDVTMKIMSLTQQGAHAVCVLSANGSISNVTLRQPTSSGGTVTYEGRFEILSLSGSFIPSENEGTKSRTGGMSISLASPDGHIVGGGLAGLLVAAGPVQVVLGSFLPGHQQEQKHKKQRFEPSSVVTPTTATVLSAEDLIGGYGTVKPVHIPAVSFQENQPATFSPMTTFQNPAAENVTSSAEDDSRGLDLSNCEVSYR